MTDSTKYKTYIDLLNDREGLFRYGLLWWCTLPWGISDMEFSWGMLKKMKTTELKEYISERVMLYYNGRYIELLPKEDYICFPINVHKHTENGVTRVYSLNTLLEIMEQVNHLWPKNSESLSYGLYDTFQSCLKKSKLTEFEEKFIEGANRVVRCFFDAGLILLDDKKDPYTYITDYSVLNNGRSIDFKY